MVYILGYILGALGILVNMLIYQQKNGQRLIIFKLISDVIWALQYLALGAFSGMAIAVIGIFREIVFYNKHKKWARSKLWLVFFIICSIVSAILTWKSVFSILPALASVISVIGYWKKTPSLSRILAFPISISMLTYDIFCYSYMGIVNEVLALISATVGIIRYRKKSKEEI